MRRPLARTKSGAPGPTAAPFARHLVIMAKVPQAGRVKTRLARAIGPATATRFYRHALSAVVGRLAADPRWQTTLAVSPDAGIANRALPATVARVPQGRGDLGQRLDRAMRRPGPGPVVIIGTDIPAVRPEHIAAAFRELGGRRAVFGPAPDGGFWLVGLTRTRRLPRLFDNVRWSTEHALADCRGKVGDGAVGIVTALNDVDEPIDYKRVAGWSGRRILPYAARHIPMRD